ncbi:MAG: outer membrane lipoprotein-sorting protein [SAR324 cluster bacterium]|nr:outer membrane lipoprotein-sorting protein [SAR324 cluster bacterium]
MPRFITAALLASWALVHPLYAEEARDIMQRALDRDNGASEVSRTKLATCRYVKKSKRLVCAEDPRVKVFESVRKDFAVSDGEDTKSVMIIRKPAGEKGIGFLQYDYEAQGKDSDQWMYLAALGKVKRIVAGSNDEPKTGSFFGSELGYEDLEARHLDDYTYTLLKTVTYRKRPCWVIEAKPTPEHARKSNYSRSIQWIDQERLLSLKILLYDRKGQPAKQIISTNVERIGGIWIARRLHVNNVQTRRQTTMALESVALNVEVADEFLTQRTLTDPAFRESTLQGLVRTLD